MNLRSLWLVTALAAAMSGCGGDQDTSGHQLDQNAKPSLTGKTTAMALTDSSDKLPAVEKLEAGVGIPAGDPQVAFNDAGDGVAVWARDATPGNTASKVVARRYSKATSAWGPLEQVSEPNLGTNPQIATDSLGNFVVVWRQGPFGAARVAARRFDKALQQWGDIQLVSSAPVFGLQDVRVAGDRFGRMIVTWAKFGGEFQIRANRFDPSSGQWNPQDELVAIPPADTTSLQSQLAVDQQGNAVIMIQRKLGVLGTSIESFRSVASGGGWSTAEPIGLIQASGNLFASIRADRLGRFMIVWRDTNASKVWSRQLASMAASWGSPVAVSGNTVPISGPALVGEPSGDMTAMWSQGGAAQIMMVSSRFSATSGTWGALQSIAGGPSASSPQLVMLKSPGDILAMWSNVAASQQDPDRLMVSRFDATSGQWTTPATFHSPNKLLSPQISVATNASGNGAAVWVQRDGTSYTIATQVIQ